jgi:CHAT domain-containing protein
LELVRWAHLATHGFFAEGALGPSLPSGPLADDPSQFLLPVRERVSVAARNPLLLSGLVLAGANVDRPLVKEMYSDSRQAILTAEAISYLSLENLELAVLSACETGLGDVAGGEGVLGLQRAFHTAGAKNVIASLWKIDDHATAVLMQLFYYHLWRQKLTPCEALRAAQLTLYHSPELIEEARSERGINLAKTQRLHLSENEPPRGQEKSPVHCWAGFVLSGLGR